MLPPKCVVLLKSIDSAGIKRENTREPEHTDGNAGAQGGKGPRTRTMKPRTRGPNQRGTANVTLSGLLNAIDGVSSQEGRVLIMTSNNPEALDDALTRPGRVDRQVLFGRMSTKSVAQIFMRMYTKDVDDFDTTEEKMQMIPATQLGLDEVSVASDSLRTLMKKFSDDFADGSKLQGMAEEFAEKIPEGKFTPAEVQGFLLTKAYHPSVAIAEVGSRVREMLIGKEQGENVVQGQAQEEGAQRGSVGIGIDGSCVDGGGWGWMGSPTQNNTALRLPLPTKDPHFPFDVRIWFSRLRTLQFRPFRLETG